MRHRALALFFLGDDLALKPLVQPENSRRLTPAFALTRAGQIATAA